MRRALAGVFVGLGLWAGSFVPALAQTNPPATQCVTQALAGGTANAITTARLPCVPTTTLLVLTIVTANTSPTPTLQPVGTVAQTIVNGSGGPLEIGELAAGSKVLLVNNGVKWFKIAGGLLGATVSINGITPIDATPDPLTSSGTIGLNYGSTLVLDGANLVVVPCNDPAAIAYTNCVQIWSAKQTFRSVVGSLGNASSGVPEGVIISATAYTLNSGSESDCGRDLIFIADTSVTLTTDPTAPVGCHISITQAGLGTVTIVDGGGATHVSRLNFTATAGQYALLGLGVYQNVGGSAAVYLLSGDGQ